MSCLFPQHYNGYLCPCGRCAGCLKDYQNDWNFRLYREARSAECARVYTLTYMDDRCPEKLNKRDVQLFFKSFRKVLDKYDIKLRYFLVGEYGSETKRPHYHALFFYNGEYVQRINDTLFLDDLVQQSWQNGYTLGDNADMASIQYCTKYLLNRDPNKKEVYRDNHFMLCSRRPGIGNCYLEEYGDDIRNNNKSYVSINNIKQKLPRYFRKKVYDDLTDEQKLEISQQAHYREHERYEKRIFDLMDRYNLTYFQATKLDRKNRNIENKERLKNYKLSFKKDVL